MSTRNSKNTAQLSCPSEGKPWLVLSRYALSMLLWRILSLAALITLWAMVSWLSGYRLPSPSMAWCEFLKIGVSTTKSHGITPDPSIWAHMLATACRAYGGLFLALVFFVPLGVVIGARRRIYCSTIGLIEFARSVPAFMLVLVFMSLHLTREVGRMTCVIFAVGILVADYTATAVLNTPPELLEVFRLMRAGRMKIFRRVMGPRIVLDAIMPTMRIGVGISLIVSLVVETLLIPERGLGVVLNSRMGKVNIAGGMALIVAAGVLGWIGNVLVSLAADMLWWFFEGRPLPPLGRK